MVGATEAAVTTLGVKFLGLARVYRHESSSVLDDMASLARAAVVLEPSLSDLLMPFVRCLGALRQAEEQGVRSTRFDQVQDSMEGAMRRASSCFMDRLGAEGQAAERAADGLAEAVAMGLATRPDESALRGPSA